MSTITFSSVTPNLVVSDMNRSVAFYRDVLGFELHESVPDREPFAFAWMKRGEVSIFLNDLGSVREEYPGLLSRPIGGTFTMFIIMEGVDALHEAIGGKAAIVMPLADKFYGMREFAVQDPDGYVITFAERRSGGES
jgi:lactoylglutathione lyase